MAESKLVLRCPYCDSTFDAEPPDGWHSAYSFDEPLLSSFHGEVKKQEFTCQNPKCRKPIMLYWYAPMEYFARM